MFLGIENNFKGEKYIQIICKGYTTVHATTANKRAAAIAYISGVQTALHGISNAWSE